MGGDIVKLLVIDHHFGHDIGALRQAAGNDVELVVISAYYFRNRATAHLPPEVTTGPLEAYWDPQIAAVRRRAERSCARALDELLALEHFDAIIAPSDTFFYVRPVVRRAQQLDLPFIVVQKETSISPGTMVEHSKRIERTFPFCSDRMFVCSERQKEFWVRAGTDPGLIDVLGQPRFDFYTRHGESEDRDGSAEVPDVLYLSYMLDAYATLDQGGADAPAWEQLRAESEDALVAAAVAGRLRLAVKPHPQQRDVPALTARLRDLAGDSWGRDVRLVNPAEDVRPLIVRSDVVVGFQTTALIEALAAGKKPIYTQWSDAFMKQRDHLIPFHDHPDLFRCVHAPEDLVGAVLSGPAGALTSPCEDDFVQEYLGVIDGAASKRVLEAIAAVVAERKSSTSTGAQVHAASRYRRFARLRALRRVAVGRSLLGAAQLLSTFGPRRSWSGIRARVELDHRRLDECSARRPWGQSLVGEPDIGVAHQFGLAAVRRARSVRQRRSGARA